MEVSSVAPGFVRIDRDNKAFLGVDTGIRGGSFAVRKLSQGTNLFGWIIDGDTCRRWDTSGLTQHAGSVYVYGPFVQVQPLRDALQQEDNEALAALERIAHAFRIAEQENILPRVLHTRGILLLEGGGVLLLPDLLVETIRDQQDDETRLQEYEPFNHPDWRSMDNLSFGLASACYRVLTGNWPYNSNDINELHTMVREETVIRPLLVRPELRTDVSDFIYQCLRLDAIPTFVQWVEAIHDWRDSGVTREISEEERSRLLQQAQQTSKQLMQQYTRRETVRKYWKQALVAIVALAVIGSIPASIIRGHLQPRRTAGMEPAEVVRLFYNAQNELDHELMDDATVDGAGSSLIREVTNLFVISRMRMGVEFESGVINASEWDREGRPPIPHGSWVYGVTGLEIEQMNDGSDEQRVFRVHYERWRPDDTPEDTDVVEPEDDLREHSEVSGMRREDIVRLRKDGDDWVIHDINNVVSTPLDFELEFEDEESRSAPLPGS